MILLALILFIICLIVLLITISTVQTGISPLPTSSKAKQAMMMMIPPEQKVYDLGSGWGTLCFAAGKKGSSGEVVGIESSLVPYLFSKLKTVLDRKRTISVLLGDIYTADISDAQVILCFLYPEAMEKLAIDIRERVAPGTIIISNTFALPGWTPVEIIELNDLYRTKILRYVY